MRFSSPRILGYFIFTVGFLVLILLYYNLDKQHKNIINFISIFGTYLTLVGLIIAFIQLESIKTTNSKIDTAVQSSLLELNSLISISELSKGLKLIDEIQNYILSDKLELSLIRMKDLRNILIQIKVDKKLIRLIETENINENIIDLGIDINNITDFLLNVKKGKINYSKVNLNLEKIASTIVGLENKLKFNNV